MKATLVKVGGSLAEYPEQLKVLCRTLSKVAEERKLAVLPGGGEFADAVRTLDKRFSLSRAVSHHMAILAMDQYGLLLADLTPNSLAVHSILEIEKAQSCGKMPIFLPSGMLLNDAGLEQSWDVTSDSIAVYLAGKLDIQKVLLITNVDGIYTCDPKKHADAKLIEKISVEQLLVLCERTSVDRFLPHLLLKKAVYCFVVNGMFPERVEAALAGQKTVGTLICR